MRKTSIVIIVILTIIMCCTGLIVMMATGIIQKGDNKNYYFESANSKKNSYIKTSLNSGSVDISEKLKGCVVSENEHGVYEVANVNDKFSVDVKVGDYVSTGQVLFVDNSGKNIIAPCDLLVTKLVMSNGFYMETFEYRNLSIQLFINADYQDRINNIEFTTINKSGEIVNLKLKSVNSYVEDGLLEVQLECPFIMLANTEIDVEVKYDTVEGLTKIPSEFVLKSGDGRAYIHISDSLDVEYIEDVYLDIHSVNDEYYIVKNNLDGYFAVYTKEEKFFDK